MMYAFYRLLGFIFRVMPINMAHWILLRICDLAYFFNPKGRAAVRENLRTVFVFEGIEPSKRLLAGCSRKTFQNFGKYLADFIRFRKLTEKQIREFVSISGQEQLETLRKSKRGAIVLTAHYGNWELGGALIAAMGFKVHAVVRPVASAPLERLYTFFRMQRGMDVIHLAHASTGIIRALKRNEVVAMVGDRDFTGNGHPHSMMGRETSLPRGAAWFAHRLQLPILFGGVHRAPDDTYILRLAPLLEPADYPTEEALQRRITELMEETILRDPCQWYIFNPFWPESPAGTK